MVETLRNQDYALWQPQIMDDYSKQECLVLTPTMISLKQNFSDIPYPGYQVKCSSGLRMDASGCSLLRNFLTK